jgi:hypothetical protein
MKPLLVTVALLAVPGVALPAENDETTPSYTAAMFVDGEQSMKNLVEFPDIDFDADLNVMCDGRASAKGRLQNAKCSSPQDPDLLFTLAVSQVFNSVRLVPATVNGRSEEVDFQFTVVFKKDGETESIDVFPNNQKNLDRLGLDYVSAQRYSPHPFPNRCSGWHRDDLIIEAAIVDATGKARDVNVMSSTVGIPASCKAGLISQLEDARWIPASYQGQFVESVWVSPIVLNTVSFKREQPTIE